jgi:hypothetical protein
MKPILLFDAEPFCFGPVSTLLNLIHSLKRTIGNKYEFIFLASNTTLQLALKSTYFDQIIECNTTIIDDLEKNRDLFERASAIIINTNLFSLKWASHFIAKKIIFVDTLFWLWDILPYNNTICKILLVQDFVGVKERIDKEYNKLPKYQIVGPLVLSDLNASYKRVPTKPFILVNFGGIETTAAPTLGFPDFFIHLLSQKEFKKFNFVFAGGGKTIERMKETYLTKKNTNFLDISCFSKSEYLGLLRCADKVIISPGLTSFYELSLSPKETFFLPPQNYSQNLQLQQYQLAIKELACFSWDTLYPELIIQSGLKESEGIYRTQKAVIRFLDSPEDQEIFANKIWTFLSEFSNSITPKIALNGIEESVAAIFSFLEEL